MATIFPREQKAKMLFEKIKENPQASCKSVHIVIAGRNADKSAACRCLFVIAVVLLGKYCGSTFASL